MHKLYLVELKYNMNSLKHQVLSPKIANHFPLKPDCGDYVNFLKGLLSAYINIKSSLFITCNLFNLGKEANI